MEGNELLPQQPCLYKNLSAIEIVRDHSPHRKRPVTDRDPVNLQVTPQKPAATTIFLHRVNGHQQPHPLLNSPPLPLWWSRGAHHVTANQPLEKTACFNRKQK